MDHENIAEAEDGRIQLILGPMFSGKSSELLRRCVRYSIANRSVFVIKYTGDTRYANDAVATHDNVKIKARNCMRLKEVESEVKKFEVIGIDEGQFFPDIVEFCESMANAGKIVIIAALDGTFERKPFGRILELIPLAESVVKLNAVCQICYSEASYSKRISSEKQVTVIGGADKYIAVCRKCFHSNESTVVSPVPKKKLVVEPGPLHSLMFGIPHSRMELPRL